LTTRKLLGRGLALAAVLAASLGLSSASLAWGSSGHRIVGTVAVKALPNDVPAFVRKAAADIGELSREPDRTKGSGKLHDEMREGSHFIDLDDEGKAMHGPHIDALPPTRQLYDDALRQAGSTLTKAGWLPYSIADAYADLQTDFALWRVAKVGEKRAKTRAQRAWFKADRIRREQLILVDIGELSHWVGDGSQPLHTSIHYNGWGDYPNPRGFTTERIHSVFEGAFTAMNVKEADVAAQLAPYEACTAGIERCTAAYIKTSWSHTVPLYELEQAGAFKGNDPRGKAFATARLAAGASKLRDLITDAWRASGGLQVGWPKVAVADVEAGKVDPWEALYGKD